MPQFPERATAAAEPQPAVSESGDGLRLAYLTTQYPKVSHTFIRREIREVEARGHQVLRLAIRKGPAVDADDLEEAEKTVQCLGRPVWSLLWDTLWVLVDRPVPWLRALWGALALNRRSERSLVRHMAYLVEACSLYRLLQAHRIQHTHVHFGTNSTSVMWLIRRLGGPTYSFTVHGPEELDAPRGHALGLKIRDAEFTVAITSFCKAQLCRWVDAAHWDKIHVVRCGIDESFFAEPPPIREESRTLLCIGRLTAQKGQLLLIDAVARLVEEGEDVNLVLAGDGEMRAEVEQRIRERNLGDHVSISGWIGAPEVRRLLLDCRAMVLPSFAEGLPIVIMEALALGRPVISTYIAGIPELVVPGENGWLVPAGDLEQLVAAMRAVLSMSKGDLERMGREGRRSVESRHRARKQALLLEGLFRAAVQGWVEP